MPKPKSYRLLCPITRALDRLGDRWTLLILRDLHAGPARFGELASGLPGLASNLLSSRLSQMQQDGLVQHGDGAYALTEDGERTAPLLFELATLGAAYPPAEDVQRPGNLRTVVVTLQQALRGVIDCDDRTDVELTIDGEVFGVQVQDGAAYVRYAPNPNAPLALSVDYEAMIAVADGRMDPGSFAAEHVQVERGSKRATQAFLKLLGRAFAPR